MDIRDFGWEHYSKSFPELTTLQPEKLGRIAVENKTGYILFTQFGELIGLLPAAARFKASTPAALPRVGDWVRIEKIPNENKATIIQVLERKSTLARIGIGRKLEEQIIATNIDTVFIVQSLDENFSLARFERFLLMVNGSGATPIIVLNKADLVPSTASYLTDIATIAPHVPILSVSAQTGNGISNLHRYVSQGQTAVFIGLSGVGKSSIINALLKNNNLPTGEVRKVDSRGRHTTTRREMILLPSGGIIIDTPGIRELQMEASATAVNETFSDIFILAQQCKFRDCDHKKSFGCKILEALATGALPRDRYNRFIKIASEQDHQEHKRKTSGSEPKTRHAQTKKNIRKLRKYRNS